MKVQFQGALFVPSIRLSMKNRALLETDHMMDAAQAGNISVFWKPQSHGELCGLAARLRAEGIPVILSLTDNDSGLAAALIQGQRLDAADIFLSTK